MISLDPVTQIQLMAGGYYLARCLQIAADLGIADLISDAPVSSLELAKVTGSDPEALARILTLLCAHGVFQRLDGSFGHTELSVILRTDHPASMRSFAQMMGVPIFWQAAIRLDDSVATGRPMGDEVAPEGFWNYFQQHPDANRKFNQTMAAKSQVVIPLVVAAYNFAQFSKIADVGGGRGHLVSAILGASPHTRGVLFDQPHVVAEAKGIASERLEVHGGSFFTDELPVADAYILMEVIHDWDDQRAEQILQAVHRAAPVRAKLLLVEAMMPENPTPSWTTTLDVVMLNVPGGSQRSLPEYEKLVNRCGFDRVREIPSEQVIQSLKLPPADCAGAHNLP